MAQKQIQLLWLQIDRSIPKIEVSRILKHSKGLDSNADCSDNTTACSFVWLYGYNDRDLHIHFILQ